MAEINFKKFYQEIDLSLMKINDKLSMKDIYENINNNKFSFDDITISSFGDDAYNVTYKGKKIFCFIYKKPVNIKYKNSNISIINSEHLKEIIKKFEISLPIINCNSCKTNFLFNFQKFKIHKKHDISLEESFNLKRLSDIEFNNFFNKEKEDNVLGKKFKNPEEFEPNFEQYFSDNEIYKNSPFTLYEYSQRRNNIGNLINDMHFLPRKIHAYFGQSGIGKSTLVITVAKYKIDHRQFGTLYLNMKCLNNLLKQKKYKKFRQILVDEIAYLFRGNYDKYLICTNKIHEFYIRNEDSIWDLINEIINFILSISNKEKYIFIFDQYNAKKDPNNKLIKLFDEFILNRDKTSDKEIGLFTFSSMNNSDIKEYKINLFKNIFDFKFKKDIVDIKNFIELNDIFNAKIFKFDDDKYEELYELLGSNIKYYNILNFNFYNQKDFEKLYNDIKQHIKDKIQKYFNSEENKRNIIQLLYFSTNTKYDINNFLEIDHYIPFKYFNPTIKKEKKSDIKYIQIEYAFPLIEEIVKELLDDIIYSKLNIYQTLISDKKIDIEARDHLFEKYITYLLDTGASNRMKRLIFEDIIITKTITLRQFIPRLKEEPIKEKKNKTKLEKGIYLFTQKIINEKLLDILIIIIDKNDNAIIIAIKITIYKHKADIFNNFDLISCLNQLYYNLKKLYDFNLNPDNIFFIYIFDKSYEKVSKNDFDEMIEKCNSFNIAYILFDPSDENFYNKEGNIIKFLKNEVKGRNNLKFEKHLVDDNDINIDIVNLIPEKYILKPFYFINYDEIKIAISIIKNDFENGDKIKGLYFSQTTLIREQTNFKKEMIYFGRSELTSKCYIVYFSLKNKRFISKFLNDDDYNEKEIEYIKKNATYFRIQNYDAYKIIYI